jgi:cell division protein DivIC
MFKNGKHTYVRNKFFIATVLFVVYAMFLDDLDIFTIINQHQKLTRLEGSCESISHKLDSTKTLYVNLKNNTALENFAREKKFFKRKDEDIFVISYE